MRSGSRSTTFLLNTTLSVVLFTLLLSSCVGPDPRPGVYLGVTPIELGTSVHAEGDSGTYFGSKLHLSYIEMAKVAESHDSIAAALRDVAEYFEHPLLWSLGLYVDYRLDSSDHIIGRETALGLVTAGGGVEFVYERFGIAVGYEYSYRWFDEEEVYSADWPSDEDPPDDWSPRLSVDGHGPRADVFFCPFEAWFAGDFFLGRLCPIVSVGHVTYSVTEQSELFGLLGIRIHTIN